MGKEGLDGIEVACVGLVVAGLRPAQEPRLPKSFSSWSTKQLRFHIRPCSRHPRPGSVLVTVYDVAERDITVL